MPLAAIPLDRFEKIAVGVERCEDVVVLKDGRVFCSEHQCAVAQIHPDGSFTRMGPKGGAPNGINADREGRILIANFGIYDGAPGPLQRFDPKTGAHETLVAEVDGAPLVSSNYPVLARSGIIYCTHSTFAPAWPMALDGRADGFVFALFPDGRVETLARNIPFANGCALDAEERHLYVNRTSRADCVRFPILPGGRLGHEEPFSPPLGRVLPPEEIATALANPPPNLGYTDGCGFDVEGNLWITLPGANRIVAVTPERTVFVVAEDPTGAVLASPTNVAFGGSDMRDLYIGSLSANYVLKTRSPIAGLRMPHQL
jgi:gluconolactonase